MKRPLLLLAAIVGAVVALLRRRQAQSDATALWREATADASK